MIRKHFPFIVVFILVILAVGFFTKPSGNVIADLEVKDEANTPQPHKNNEEFLQNAKKAKKFYESYSELPADSYILFRLIAKKSEDFEHIQPLPSNENDFLLRVIDGKSRGKDNYRNVLGNKETRHTAKSLYCDLYGYSSSDFHDLLTLESGNGTYEDTHLLLSLQFLEENGCYTKEELAAYKERVAQNIVSSLKTDNEVDDLFLERITFMYWAGFGDLIREDWMQKIKEAQNEDGGWSLTAGEPSHPHATGFATLNLIYFSEGKEKQAFYPVYEDKSLDVIPKVLNIPIDQDYHLYEKPDYKLPEVLKGYFPSYGDGQIKPPARYDIDSFSPADQERIYKGLEVAYYYADINNAVKDGYALQDFYGRYMGIHAVNPSYMESDEVVIEKPEFLTYVKNGKTGRFQLMQLGFIHKGHENLKPYKLFDSKEAVGHFHKNFCYKINGILMNGHEDGDCEGKEDYEQLGTIWMMHFAVNIYNEKGMFSDRFELADYLNYHDLSYTFYGERVN